MKAFSFVVTMVLGSAAFAAPLSDFSNLPQYHYRAKIASSAEESEALHKCRNNLGAKEIELERTGVTVIEKRCMFQDLDFPTQQDKAKGAGYIAGVITFLQK